LALHSEYQYAAKGHELTQLHNGQGQWLDTMCTVVYIRVFQSNLGILRNIIDIR